MSYSSLTKIVKKIEYYSGIPRLHPHLFRSSAATRWIKKGVSIEKVARLLGHASLNTSYYSYINISVDDLREATKP